MDRRSWLGSAMASLLMPSLRPSEKQPEVARSSERQFELDEDLEDLLRRRLLEEENSRVEAMRNVNFPPRSLRVEIE